MLEFSPIFSFDKTKISSKMLLKNTRIHRTLHTNIKKLQIGRIGITECSGKVVRLWLPNELNLINSPQSSNNETLEKAFNELDEYFTGKRHTFSVDLCIETRDFTNKTLKTLQNVPYGSVRTYKEIAILLNKPNAFRAVGTACNKNPIPIFIPCHRVIGNNGKLRGYRGGLALKQYLLKLESINK